MKFLFFLIIIFLPAGKLASQVLGSESRKEYPPFLQNNVKQGSLMSNYDIKFCKIDISASDTTRYISGYVEYMAIVLSNRLDTFLLQLSDDFTVDSVIFNKSVNNFVHNNDEILVPVTPPLINGDTAVISVFYSGTPVSQPGNRGITTSEDMTYHKWVTFTLAEPFFALFWFPCKEDLTDKIDSAYIFITVDSSLKAGSNGLLKSVTPMPGHRSRYEWKTYYPIDFYLLSFSVSDYSEYDFYAKPADLNDSILVQNYIYSNCLNDYKTSIDQTKDFIEYFSGLFGSYPFSDEKYGHCMIPVDGGMEHQTMTSLGYFDLTIVSHELSHQWFGDATTCSNWQDIWLNEGFASYCEYLANDKFSSQGKQYMISCHNYALSQPYGSVYVPFESMNDYHRIFNYYLTYQKGAAIIHELRYELNNDSLFFLALRNYLSAYKYRSASCPEFKSSFENTTNRNLTDFFNEWYYGFGYPLYSINWYRQHDTLVIHSYQSTTSDSTSLFKMSLDFEFYHDGGDTVIRVFQDTNSVDYKFILPYYVDSISVNPDNWSLMKVLFIHEGITDVPIQNFSVSPNPFSDRLTVNFEEDHSVKIIEIYDITGRKYLCMKSAENKININTSLFPQGIYFLKMTGKTSVCKKIVKVIP